MDIPLDEVIYADAISSGSTGAAVDADSTPTFAVYEESTDTDIGVGGNMTKRTSLTGNYRCSFTASAANGFELGKWYSVVGTATIGGIACKGVLKSFRIVAAENTAGYPPSDAIKIGGTTQTARDIGASVLLSSGTGTGQLDFTSGIVKSNLMQILGTALTETVGGYLAAGFKKLLDVAAPVFTLASVNQAGDSYARIGSNGAGLTAIGDTRMANLDATITSRAPSSTALSTATWSGTRAGYLDNLSAGAVAQAATALSTAQWTNGRAALLDNLDAAISSLNNLSALINIYGSPLLEIPDSGSTTFAFTVVNRDNEGKLADLDASPTLAAANAAGTSRSANLSAVSHPSTGRYTFTYSVASDAAAESLRITVTGAISAEARYIEWIGAVVNYDTLTTLSAAAAGVADIQSRIPAALVSGRMASDSIAISGSTTAADNFEANIGNLDAAVTSRASQASVDVIDGIVDLILADTNELQTDWANGGRLDLLIDSIILSVATNGVVLSAATCNKIADHVRRRSQVNVFASSDGDAVSVNSEYGAIQQAQKSALVGSTLTIKNPDGTTLGTRTVTSGTADPITGIS